MKVLAILTAVLLLAACNIAGGNDGEPIPGDFDPERKNIALNKPVKASSVREGEFGNPPEYQYYPAELAVDGIWDTKESRWLVARLAGPHWLEIDLEDEYAVDTIVVWTGDPSTSNNDMIKQFKMQYLVGEDWVDIPGASVEGNDRFEVVFTFDPVTTSHVRFHSDERDIIRVREILVYGDPVE